MSYYGLNDVSLGAFLEQYCFDENYQCTAMCNVPIRNHVRGFVHNQGRVLVGMEQLKQPIMVDASSGVVMWSWCKKCGFSSPVVPTNDDVSGCICVCVSVCVCVCVCVYVCVCVFRFIKTDDIALYEFLFCFVFGLFVRFSLWTQHSYLQTWNISLAKYLELTFYGSKFVSCNSSECGHSLHQDHVRYFAQVRCVCACVMCVCVCV